MPGPLRNASESASSFEARVLKHVRSVEGQGGDQVVRSASAVYAEGVVAGLSLAVAALQRRERIIDYLARWEAHKRRCEARDHA
jgi:hypothetical protein